MNPKLETFFKEQGFTKLSPIQEKTYPLLSTGHNILGLAPTGSGKTLAYTIPLIEQVTGGAGTQLMIVAPSQELAAQLTDVVRKWAKVLELKTVALIGGANVRRQIEKLKKHPEIVVGTPGRMLELTEAKKLKLHKLRAVVLDETDELLTDETLVSCRELISHGPARVQLSFFSATKTVIMNELPRWFGVEVKEVDVRSSDRTQGQVTHYLLETPVRKRVDTLRKLAHLNDFYALVFFKQVATIQAAAEKLHYLGVKAAVLDGQQRQVQREQALRDLRQRKVSLLLTTDVAARGLDIEQLPAVVNFDLPKDANTYIHRVGRTGRMGATGTVINLGNEHDLRHFKQLLAHENYTLCEGYLYKGKLVDEEKFAAAKQAVTDQPEKSKPKVKKKTKNKYKADLFKKKESVQAPKKHKKKKRKRQQLNKGKHDKKKN
ncbi:DEAD/DEAH box helicase [Liquorilactobacillus capillatus]|uniref:ATP-dependent RNA helicase n=1 Tax=Liquorilactobacillus capillatus DSM 19910 TaxID=1423731 RepID=A0A0R1LXW0_9LACO|nr:DEAD/DEAH box helicase [Liquorilactobacillus capillatus]KRL00273.1 ATP-dependent RNA helicase [Liquorilactobacillus capillatus DSM 19910]